MACTMAASLGSTGTCRYTAALDCCLPSVPQRSQTVWARQLPITRMSEKACVLHHVEPAVVCQSICNTQPGWLKVAFDMHKPVCNNATYRNRAGGLLTHCPHCKVDKVTSSRLFSAASFSSNIVQSSYSADLEVAVPVKPGPEQLTLESRLDWVKHELCGSEEVSPGPALLRLGQPALLQPPLELCLRSAAHTGCCHLAEPPIPAGLSHERSKSRILNESSREPYWHCQRL